MPYNISPDLSLQTTNKGDGEKFDQNVLNNNFIKLDARSAQLRTQLSGLTQAIQTPYDSEAARDAAIPNPSQGRRIYRTDKFWEETYFAAYSATTNPGGTPTAGWYPSSGRLPQMLEWRKNAAIALGNDGITAPDDGNMWDSATRTVIGGFTQLGTAGSDSSFWKVPVTGLYELNGRVQWNPNGTGSRSMWFIRANGTTAPAIGGASINAFAVGSDEYNAVGSSYQHNKITVQVNLQKDQLVSLWVRQQSGGALNLTTGDVQSNKSGSYFGIRYIAPPLGVTV